jgi:hypothetical protein
MIDPDSAHLLHTGEYAQVLLNVSADPLFRSAALVALGRCGEARQVLLDATQRAAVGDDAVTTLMLRVNLAVLDASTTSGTLAALELALASAKLACAVPDARATGHVTAATLCAECDCAAAGGQQSHCRCNCAALGVGVDEAAAICV